VVADDGFAPSVPTTKADFAPDLSERLSFLQERLTRAFGLYTLLLGTYCTSSPEEEEEK
jgi:hypothetical protein